MHFWSYHISRWLWQLINFITQINGYNSVSFRDIKLKSGVIAAETHFKYTHAKR